ncbi:ribosomal protein S12 methylthiotransferase [Ruminococcaceae bacterium YRB3002]|nr:ribosomal protein S12 methylthiotransferase [Ruminococcaceae bacterium YRB3002]
MERDNVRISIVALGCSKNLVDAECMSRALKDAGYIIADDVEESDAVVINTCGFIESAKKEAIDTILECADIKSSDAPLRFIIVTGCLSQRYPDDILQEMPEVDAVLGTAHYSDIVDTVDKLFENGNKVRNVSEPGSLDHLMTDKDVSTSGYAWIKIGEGCLHRCAFCAIPLIRGKFTSRPIGDILKEAEILASRGYKEIILVAQDTTNYGVDLYKERKISELLRRLAEIDGIELIRVMYGYMDGFTDELINEVRDNPKAAHYFDIPIQHGCDRILKAMNRFDTEELITKRLDKIRSEIPDAIIRTTVMVGFPGETEEDFARLKENLLKWKFDRLGCFIFSPEEGTKAFDMPDQIPEDVKRKRYEEIYELQRQISREVTASRLGTKVVVTIDSVSEDGIFYKGRSYGEAPEDDPVVYVLVPESEYKEELKIGGRYEVEIVECSDYDMTGVLI